MTAPESEAHSSAVVYLQALLSKHRPGSVPHVIAERALDLAFNRMVARGVALEQQLLQEAEALIERQVGAKLITQPYGQVAPPAHVQVPTRARTRARFVALSTSARPRMRRGLPQAEVWATPEGHQGAGSAHLY